MSPASSEPFSREQVEKALDAKAAHLGEKDLGRIAANPEAVHALIAEFPEKWEKARRQARLLFELVADARVALESRKQAAAALIYLGAPIDLVPDDETDGHADDAAVVALAIERTEHAVRVHCAEKGLPLADYLG
jgi:uncharacterized membrane protein YkvA (DUF1232 family)